MRTQRRRIHTLHRISRHTSNPHTDTGVELASALGKVTTAGTTTITAGIAGTLVATVAIPLVMADTLVVTVDSTEVTVDTLVATVVTLVMAGTQVAMVGITEQ